MPLVATTRQNPAPSRTQPLDLIHPPRQIDSPIRPQNAQVGLTVAHFLDSQISGEMIHRWDGAFAIPSGWFARGVRDFPGPPEGAERQYRDGGFRCGGLRPVFHAKRVVSVVSAHP